MGVASDLHAPADTPLEGFPLSTECGYAWTPGPVWTLLAVDPDVARALAVLRLGPAGSDLFYVTRLGTVSFVTRRTVSGFAARAPGCLCRLKCSAEMSRV